jgi:O-acetylhomoserine/O-acetylserine sulfhydrylase-like pyridoxal-dependent enzyme
MNDRKKKVRDTYKSVPIHIRFLKKLQGNIGSVIVCFALERRYSWNTKAIQRVPESVKRAMVGEDRQLNVTPASSSAVTKSSDAPSRQNAPRTSRLLVEASAGPRRPGLASEVSWS